jgi:hypothetical protein
VARVQSHRESDVTSLTCRRGHVGATRAVAAREVAARVAAACVFAAFVVAAVDDAEKSEVWLTLGSSG